MAIWTLAKKEARLLLRDRVAAVVLLAMPVLFMAVLGFLVGDTYGRKEPLRISVVNLDIGPCSVKNPETGQPYANWGEFVQVDLRTLGQVNVEILPSVAEAERLIRDHQRAAVLVFERDFSAKINDCSFLVGGTNPFHSQGVYLDRIDAELLRDQQQIANATIVDQVAQVSLLRVLLPLMIGKAFGKLSDEKFIKILGEKVNVPVPFPPGSSQNLGAMIRLASLGVASEEVKMRRKVGEGVQAALTQQFENYDLTGLTWEQLTKSKNDGSAPLSEDDRSKARYQIIVPAFTVLFAFFLVLNVGWVLVAERQQGTLKRLRMAPIGSTQILLGKFIPYLLLSILQGVFLLLAGKVFFGMRWGPDDWSLAYAILWLLPVVASTSLAAMGFAMLVAALARTDAQVALYGGVPVLIMALIGGCVLPRALMPEQTQWLTLLTPHGWALSAYLELLPAEKAYQPNLDIVTNACLVLSGFGLAFLAAAWASLRLD